MYERIWTDDAKDIYNELKHRAHTSLINRKKSRKNKSSRVEGTFKQLHKALELLVVNPRHPSLNIHPYSSIENPYNTKEKVYEAYAQNNTPAAYRIFWCYGPKKNQITIIAITQHP